MLPMHRNRIYESLGAGSSEDSLPVSPLPVQNHDDHAFLLSKSLDQYDQQQKRGNTRWPVVMLVLLIYITVSSSGGITLAVVLMVQPLDRLPEASLARDVILFASILGFLYTALHVRGARKGYVRHRAGPLHIHSNVTHAGALIVARLAICVWLGALIASAVLTAKAADPFAGFFGAVPILDLLICAGALPSFILVSATMEKSATPFDTAGLSSKPGLNRKRLAALADDSLEADMSISRRATVHKLKHSSRSPFSLGSNFDTETTQAAIESPVPAPLSRPVLEGWTVKTATGAHVVKPPQPTYSPGTWRTEWNGVADRVGIPRIKNSSGTGSSYYHDSDQSIGPGGSTYYQTEEPHLDDVRSSSFCYTSSSLSPSLSLSTTTTDSSSLPSESNCLLSRSRPKTKHQNTVTDQIQPPPKAATASSTTAEHHQTHHRRHRSNLSTVRYANRPDVAVRQPATQITRDDHCDDDDDDDQPSPATTTISGILEAAAVAAAISASKPEQPLPSSSSSPSYASPPPPEPKKKSSSVDYASSYTSAITSLASSLSASPVQGSCSSNYNNRRTVTSPPFPSSSSRSPTNVATANTLSRRGRTERGGGGGGGGPLSSHPVYTTASAAEKKRRRSRRRMDDGCGEGVVGSGGEKGVDNKTNNNKKKIRGGGGEEKEKGGLLPATTTTNTNTTNNFSRPLGTGVYGYDGHFYGGGGGGGGVGHNDDNDDDDGKKKKKKKKTEKEKGSGDGGDIRRSVVGIAVNY